MDVKKAVPKNEMDTRKPRGGGGGGHYDDGGRGYSGRSSESHGYRGDGYGDRMSGGGGGGGGELCHCVCEF